MIIVVLEDLCASSFPVVMGTCKVGVEVGGWELENCVRKQM